VMHQRERLLALEPRDRGLVAYTLRTNKEVRKPEDYFASIPDVDVDEGMVEIAAKIIDQQEGAFDPTQFNDRYEDALRKLIQEKEKGHTVKAEAPKEAEVIDLMEALRRSLGQDSAPRRASSSSSDGRKAPAAKKTGARKASTARKSTAKKRA
jgi:DNA end-binding protein Ku